MLIPRSHNTRDPNVVLVLSFSIRRAMTETQSKDPAEIGYYLDKDSNLVIPLADRIYASVLKLGPLALSAISFSACHHFRKANQTSITEFISCLSVDLSIHRSACHLKGRETDWIGALPKNISTF